MFTLRNTMIFNLIMGACLALLATACSDDDNKDFDAVTERAAKVNIGFSRYFDANGTSTQLKWNSGDQAILRLASDGSSYMASPIRPGQTSSLFLFTVKSPGAATVVSYWPTDAPVTVGNGEIGIEIPAIQDGTVSPLLIGADSQAISSYEGCDITLRQFPALMMVSIGRGNYTVESIDVRGNAGEKTGGPHQHRRLHMGILGRDRNSPCRSGNPGKLRARRHHCRRTGSPRDTVGGIHRHCQHHRRPFVQCHIVSSGYSRIRRNIHHRQRLRHRTVSPAHRRKR